MLCPHCNSDLVRIEESVKTNEEIYRKRKCLRCKKIFYTIEYEIEPNSDFIRQWHYNRALKEKERK